MKIYSVVATIEDNEVFAWIVGSYEYKKRADDIVKELDKMSKVLDECVTDSGVKEIIEEFKKVDEHFYTTDDGSYPKYRVCESEVQ